MGKLPDTNPLEPAGTYQVWHRERDGFRHVADVEAGNRLAALILPYINNDHEEFERVTKLVGDARCITYGDVIVNPAGEAFEIYRPEFGGTGFRETTFPLHARERAILEEMRAEEYAARVSVYGEADAATYEQRVREGAATIRHLPPAPPPVSREELEAAVTELEQGWRAMPTDQDRLQKVYTQIRKIKAAEYPTMVNRDDGYQIIERPWKEMPEPSKLAMLQDAVDWSGIGNRDQAHILLAEVDPGRITDAQRNRLIDMATAATSLREAFGARSNVAEARDQGQEQKKDRGIEM